MTTVAGEEDLQRRLRALFLEELQDNLAILADGLASLEDQGVDADLVTQLFRSAHSLKGAAHSAGVSAAVAPCNRMEETFAGLRDGAQQLDRATLEALEVQLAALVRLERELRPDAAPTPAAGTGARTAPAAAPAEPGDVRARVAVGRLDRLVERSSALIAATHRLHSLAGDLGEVAEERSPQAARPLADGATGADGLARLAVRAQELDRHLRTLAEQLVDNAQELRLQSFHDVTAGLDRSVRELCRATGTDARLVLEGGDVEVDRDVGDALREPLLHLVRNAVDHGIEAPHERAAAGKPTSGTVRVAAREEGTMLRITVSDDGGGVDVERLRTLADRDAAEPRSEADVELAFVPGLSTARAVTDVSGRGIGLDAARAKVEAIGGTFHLATTLGRGTELDIQVPRSLAVLRAMVLDVGDGDLVAVPMTGVARLHRLADGDVEHLEGRLAVVLGDHRRPAVGLADALSLSVASADGHGVALEVPDEEGVLLAGRAVTELELVLRSLPTRVGDTAGLLGAAILADGEPALVANPSAALRAGLAMTAPPPPARDVSRRPRILLAEDTVTTRALERSILERAGYEVVVAVDGADALEQLGARAVVDLVVTDVDMPRLDGIELCRAIRTSVRHRNVPVILVTSLASDADRQRGLDAGANAYIVKSAFDQAALLDAVARFV